MSFFNLSTGAQTLAPSTTAPALTVNATGGGTLQLANGSGNTFIADANGNVGIGTGVPLSKLDVNGFINASGIKGIVNGTVSSGYIGETITVSFTGITNGTSETQVDVPGTSITIGPGVFRLYPQSLVDISIPSGSRSSLNLALTYANNTSLISANMYDTTTSGGGLEQYRILFDEVVYLTAATTFKLRYSIYKFGGTHTVYISVRNGKMVATRIA